MVDPIANMFTGIRNASAVGKETVVVPYSKIKMEIAKLLHSKGYIKEVRKRRSKDGKIMEIILNYKKDGPAVSMIKRVSKPSRRVYTSYKEIYPVGNGIGMRILSTPKGIITDKEARKQKVGGEIIAEIW